MSAEPKWRVVHYETEEGDCPIAEFLDGLTRKERAKVLAQIDLLEEKGPNLHRPYADLLRDRIHELRVRMSPSGYRVLYFFCHRTDIVLTHGFRKQTARVPKAQIDRAKRYRAEWIGRHHENA